MAGADVVVHELLAELELATGKEHEIRLVPRELHVRLLVGKDEAAVIDDEFTLVGGTSPQSTAYRQTQIVNNQAYAGAGFVDLVFTALKPKLSYWLECKRNEAESSTFSYGAFEGLSWDKLEPLTAGWRKSDAPRVAPAAKASAKNKPHYWKLDQIDAGKRVVVLKRQTYALHVRVPVPAEAAAGIADKFTLIGAKTFKSPLYKQSKVVKADATKGDGFVDLIFEDLKPSLKYWLDCRHGDLPPLPFSSIEKSTPGEHERPSEATAYFVFEGLRWEQIEPIMPSSGAGKSEKLLAGGGPGPSSKAKPRRWQLEKVDTHKKVVALENRPMVLYLTFDDGPCQVTDAVLDVLAGGEAPLAKAPATFFLKGSALAPRPVDQVRIVRRMLTEGHAIGNHTYSHKRMTPKDYADVNLEEVRKDFAYNVSYFRDLFAKHPDPGSAYQEFPGFRLARLPGSGKTFLKYVDMVRKEFKVSHVGWDYEYAPHATFGHVNIDDELVQGVSAEFHGLPRDRQIVLLHDHHWQAGKLQLFVKLVAALANIATLESLLPMPSLKPISPG